MKLLTVSFLFLLSASSCKTKTIEPIFQTLDIYASKADKVIITYYNKQNLKEAPISKNISNSSEIAKLRSLIKESRKSEDCYHPTGMITFYNNHQECGSLEFGLTSECPSVYVFIEGKPITYKISYQLGMFLDYINQNSNAK